MPNPAAQRLVRRSSFSLRTRIGAVFAISVFATAGILGGLIDQSSRNQLRARIGQSLATDAARMAERLNTEMAARARELALLGALDPLRDLREAQPALSPPLPTPPGTQRVQAMLDGLKRGVPAYASLALTDPAGHVLAATEPAMVGTDVSTRASFREGLRGRVANSEEEARTMDIAYPIRGADGSVVGVIVAALTPQWMAPLAAATLTADDEGQVTREMFVVSSHDRVLYGSTGKVGEKLTLPAIARARAGFLGWSVETWPDGPFLSGDALAAGVGPYPGPGSVEMKWTVLVRERPDLAFLPAYALRQTIFTVGSVLAVLFACAGWLLAGWITAPLKRIAVAAERLRQGDDVELPRIRGPAEIDSLSTSLRALVATLTRKQLALDELQEIALHDPLTGLLNRHGLHERLQGAIRAVRAEGTALLIFMLDLDGFKAVNDTLGHAVGDCLLQLVAARLRQSARPGDLVARLGGDEFVLVLRARDGFQDVMARAAARRALAAVGAPYDVDRNPVRIGCSLGGACWPEHAADTAGLNERARLEDVIEKADAALYAVKRAGKGRILFHGETLATA